MPEPNTKSKILVIDDEQGIRDLLSYELGARGYEVVTAVNGEEGMQKLSQDKFHLVISDVKMPKMNGLQVLEAVKNIDSDIEVIMATGFGSVETAVLAMKRGAYDFIQKPFNLDEVVHLVENALEKSELRIMSALYEASKAIFSNVRLDDLLPVLVKQAMKLLKADSVSIMLMGDDGKLLLSASAGLDTAVQRDAHLSLGEGIAGRVAEQNDSVIIVGPPGSDSRFADIVSRQEILSSMICPIRSKNRLLGVMCIARTVNKIPFHPSDLKQTHVLLSQITQAIDNARLYLELEHKISALNQAYVELSETKDKLVQIEKLAAIGELAAGVAHELNNPLTSIIGLADLLIDGGSQSDETMRDYRTIKEQSDRCRKIILNLLQFARKQTFKLESGNVNDVVERTVEWVGYDLTSSGVNVVKELDRDIPPINFDANRIQQVLLNLINNSRDALANRSRPKLMLKTERSNGFVMIYVSDTGCGIPAGAMSKIFNPFYTTKSVGKGTGLGLSISFGIIKDHGGSIHVESKEGEGTTFRIELPVTH